MSPLYFVSSLSLSLSAPFSHGQMDCDELGRPLAVLLPKLLEFFGHANEPFRRYALGSVNQFLLSMPAALTAMLPQYLQVL